MSRGIAGNVSAGGAVASGATTIDALFAPLPSVEMLQVTKIALSAPARAQLRWR